MQRALDKDDPHYHYDLQTSLVPPAPDDLAGCAMAETRELVDGGYLTIRVVPKHRYSLQDAPIQGSLTVNIADPAASAQFKEAFAAFEHFGRALTLPEERVSVSISAPGGRGMT